MPSGFLASFSRCCRQYVLSQPLGKTSKEIWPPMEKLEREKQRMLVKGLYEGERERERERERETRKGGRIV